MQIMYEYGQENCIRQDHGLDGMFVYTYIPMHMNACICICMHVYA